jgi:integrase/recombinase XerD
MSNAGVPIRVIQEISGHRTLDELYKYLEVKPEQVKGAIANLSMLTPIESESEPEYVGKPSYDDLFSTSATNSVEQ